jgi:hypothetical protein
MDTDDLIDEVVDALGSCAAPSDDRSSHLQLINSSGLLGDPSFTSAPQLNAAHRFFLWQTSQDYMSRATSRYREARRLANDLMMSHDGFARRWVFHGSLFGNIHGIIQEGLSPGRSPVWKGTTELRDHADLGVYLAPSWRQAYNWACMAASQSRRRGSNRLPVIFRIAYSAIDLEADERARAPDNFRSRMGITPQDLELMVGEDGWVARWQPVSQLSQDECALQRLVPSLSRE